MTLLSSLLSKKFKNTFQDFIIKINNSFVYRRIGNMFFNALFAF